MPVATHDISEIDLPIDGHFTSLIEKMQMGDEVIFTRQGRKIARLVPIRQDSRETLAAQRRAVLEEFQRAASSRITPGPDAAHSQDFLYDDDGLPA